MKFRLPISFGLALCLTSTANAQWTDVGTNPITSVTATYTSLVKDNANNYYVSYYAGGQPQGSVQKFNGSLWSPLGGSLGITPGTALYGALCVNGQGEVYYSFQDGSNSSGLSIKKYTPTSNLWTDAGVNISAGVVNYQNLKIVPSTNLPIAVYNSSGIKAKRYTGSSWVEVGASPIVSGTGANHSMVVGSNDTVYVAVQIGTAYSVYKNHINANSSEAWQLVGAAGFASGGSSNQFTVSLAIDGSNKLYMAYRALATPDGSKAAVYKYDAGVWAPLGTIGFSDYAVEHISIAVTPAGVPTVAFRENNPTDKTKVYTLVGTTWSSLGTASANLGNYNSLILDNDAPVVAFCNGTGVNGGVVTVRKYAATSVGIDSIDVATISSAPAIINTNGGTLPVQAVFYPSSTSNQNVLWSIVPGTGSATISSSGIVTAVTNGTVYAKAVSIANPTKFDSLLINISNQTVNADSLNVTTLNNVPSVITTNAGALQMAVQFYPANTSNQNVTWSIVAGTGAATVSSTGLVTAVANGTVYAKAISISNPTKFDSLMITISNQTVVADSIDVVTQNNVPAVITSNAGLLQMEAQFFPVNTSNQNVTWSISPVSGNASISVAGLITASSNGIVYAKAVSVANPLLSDSLLITISNQIVAIDSLDVQTLNNVPPNIVSASGNLQMEAVVYPSNATVQNVTWSIIPITGSATISTTGLVTALTDGNVYAKAVSSNNNNISDSLLIVISNQSTRIGKYQRATNFKVYPSPATSVLYVDAVFAVKTIYVIYDLNGQAIQKGSFVGKNWAIPISSLSLGNYVIVFETEKGEKENMKFVKK